MIDRIRSFHSVPDEPRAFVQNDKRGNRIFDSIFSRDPPREVNNTETVDTSRTQQTAVSSAGKA